MRVLLADKLPDHARIRLAANGMEVVLEPTLKGSELAQRLKEFDPDVLVVRSTKVQAEHLQAARSLSLIVRAGAGVNTIDVPGAAARGVYVANCPGKNATAVAELAFGLILALDRHIPNNVRDLRAGQWNKKTYSNAVGLRGQTLGIIGTGMIGAEVARLARAFGMEVLAWSRSLTEERALELGVKRYDSPEDVALRSNILSVHLALTPQTRGFISRGILDQLKPGSLFINTCRAEVVDEEALLHALNHGGIRAGLDVFSNEPAGKEGAFEHPLAQHPAVFGTHHIGASTLQAQMAVADEACRVVETYRDTGRVPNCVNLTRPSGADHMLNVRHLDRVGVLASVLDLLRAENISVGEMENLIFDGEEAAVARIRIRGAMSPTALTAMESDPNILSATCVAL